MKPEVIIRPMGTSTRMVPIPFGLLDTVKKWDNIMKSSVGKQMITLFRTTGDDGFTPCIQFLIMGTGPFRHEYYEVSCYTILDSELEQFHEFANQNTEQNMIISVL